jgi:hypothetical protein
MTARVISFLLSGMRDTSGQPLNGGLVYTYTAGTLTPKNTYTDLALSLEQNPIQLDSNGMKQVYADGNYKFVIHDSNDVPLYTFDNLYYGSEAVPGFGNAELTLVGAATVGTSAAQYQQLLDGKPHFVPASGVAGSANAITLAPSPGISGVAAGQYWSFIAEATSTNATVTITTNGQTARTVKKIRDGAKVALDIGDIENGNLINVYDDGTNLIFVNPPDNSMRKNLWGGTAGGSANAVTLTTVPAYATFNAGDRISFIAANTSSSQSVTVNINGAGVQNLILPDGNAGPVPGNIAAGFTYEAVYNGVNWCLVTSLHEVVATAGVTTVQGTVVETNIAVLSIPAGKFLNGKTIRVRIVGYVSESLNISRTVTIKADLGGTALLGSGVIATVQNLILGVVVDITLRSGGLAVQYYAAEVRSAAALSGAVAVQRGNAVVDLSTAKNLNVSVVHSNSSANLVSGADFAIMEML